MVTGNMANSTKGKLLVEQKNIKAESLIDCLDNMDEGRTTDDTQSKRISILDSLCLYIEDRNVLFRVVEDLLLYGPTFGRYYDLIIPRFHSDTVVEEFIKFSNDRWDNWREDTAKLLAAIECEDESGFYIRDGVLIAVYKESEVMIIPNTVHTLNKYCIGDYDVSIIKKIVLPNTIRCMEDAFCLYKGNFKIEYQGSVEEWKKIKVGKDSSGSTEWFSELNVSFANN